MIEKVKNLLLSNKDIIINSLVNNNHSVQVKMWSLIAQQIYQLFKDNPDEPKPHKHNYISAVNEVITSGYVCKDCLEAGLIVMSSDGINPEFEPKPDEGRLIDETVIPTPIYGNKIDITEHLKAQRDLTASILWEKIRYWQEKCWNDTMSAKKSGYDDAKAGCQARVERIKRGIEQRFFRDLTECPTRLYLYDNVWQEFWKKEGMKDKDIKIVVEPIPLERALEEAYKLGLAKGDKERYDIGVSDGKVEGVAEGINEVVEWGEGVCMEHGMRKRRRCDKCWQDQKKKWGLDEG